MRPVVVAVAITGSMPRKKDNPSPHATPREPMESMRQAFEAGAAPVHLHIAAGVGRFQSEAIDWTLSRGASALRAGREDNIRIGNRLASNNAESLGAAAARCARRGARPASFGLKAA